MEIRTYRAESIQEGLRMVRDDLGPDAIVLQTRQVRSGGLFGLMGRGVCLEIIASADPSLDEPWLPQDGRMDRGIDLS
jgi:flagellar biosynthesis protein FlhF